MLYKEVMKEVYTDMPVFQLQGAHVKHQKIPNATVTMPKLCLYSTRNSRYQLERKIKSVMFVKHLDLSPSAPIFLFLNCRRNQNLFLFLISLFTTLIFYIAASGKEEADEKKKKKVFLMTFSVLEEKKKGPKPTCL